MKAIFTFYSTGPTFCHFTSMTIINSDGLSKQQKWRNIFEITLACISDFFFVLWFFAEFFLKVGPSSILLKEVPDWAHHFMKWDKMHLRIKLSGTLAVFSAFFRGKRCKRGWVLLHRNEIAHKRPKSVIKPITNLQEPISYRYLS